MLSNVCDTSSFNCIADEECFFIFKTSLPFCTTASKVESFLSTATSHAKCISDAQKHELIFTFISHRRFSLALKYAKIVFDELQGFQKRDVVLTLGYHLTSDADIDALCDLASQYVSRANPDEVRQFALINSNNYKPILFSGLRRISAISPKLMTTITDLALGRLVSRKDKLTCIERLVHRRLLQKSELDFLIECLTSDDDDDELLSGRAIDCLLKCDYAPECVRLAHRAIRTTDNREEWYRSENAIHYVKLSDAFVEELKSDTVSQDLFIGVVEEIVNLANTVSISDQERDNVYHVAGQLILSGYTYEDITVEKIMGHVWTLYCKEYELKRIVVDEFSRLGKETCVYGILTNMLMALGPLADRQFTQLSDLATRDQEAMEKLKAAHSRSDEDFWSDPTKIESELLSILETIS